MTTRAPVKGAVEVSRVVKQADDPIPAAQAWFRSRGWEPVSDWGTRFLGGNGAWVQVHGWAIPPKGEVS